MNGGEEVERVAVRLGVRAVEGAVEGGMDGGCKGREGEKMTKTGRIGARARARAQMGLEGEG